MHGEVYYCPEDQGFAVCVRVEWAAVPLYHLACGHAVPMKEAQTIRQYQEANPPEVAEPKPETPEKPERSKRAAPTKYPRRKK